MLSPATAVFYGILSGALAGWLSRLALKRVLNSPDRVFYSVFIAGILARLGLLVAFICLLHRENPIIIVLFTVSMILVQMFFEAFPLKHGTKTNT